tara:strand:- start:483 stop:1598 length:1116 start_codon:yes stop_codon:yes gene_type:complete
MSDQQSPYADLPTQAFWRLAVTQGTPSKLNNIYQKKFKIRRKDRIATAGSCFAQHITRNLRERGFNVIDSEPAPHSLKPEERVRYSYGIYSARFGNIYTTRQLLQLLKEANGQIKPPENIYIWKKQGRFIDGFRPAVEPNGFEQAKEVALHRKSHLNNVKEMILDMDLFIFTLGLTEGWIHRKTGLIFPSAPGVIAGEFDKKQYEFINLSFQDCLHDLHECMDLVTQMRKGRPCNYLFTVSPVPLTATASNQHVLVATTQSKATLRCVANEMSQYPNIDYFPSYELVTNPARRSEGYDDNLRTIKDETVNQVMNHFFEVHQPNKKTSADITESQNTTSSKTKKVKARKAKPKTKSAHQIQCEEEFNDAFGQ